MKKKHILYVLTWILIMIVLSGDKFSYHETRKLMKSLFFFFNPETSIRTILKWHEFVRKALHVINYAILSWLVLCAWIRSLDPIPKWTPRAAVFCVAVCFLYALSEEWMQSFTKARTPSILDIILDVLGATIIQCLCMMFATSRKRANGPKNQVQ